MGSISADDVKKVAKLANLTLSPEEESKFSDQFSQTLKVIDQINELETSKVEPTSQVTNLKNVTRPDIIDESRSLSQDQALSNAKSTQDGFFKVPAIFNE